MTAVALIGGDGAGKTTLADALVDRFPKRVDYLYMGTNAASSNFALPSTRFVYAQKVKLESQARWRRGEKATGPISLHGIEHRKDTRGPVWAAARLANRVAEETMRQIVSWVYQARGSLVVYDRHFLFDFSSENNGQRRLSDRLHMWFLEHLYPKPHLVLFLDAPSRILYDRKQEVPEEYLDERRRVFLHRGSRLSSFAVIDAAAPPDQVYEEAAGMIMALLEKRSRSWRRHPRNRTGMGGS